MTANRKNPKCVHPKNRTLEPIDWIASVAADSGAKARMARPQAIAAVFLVATGEFRSLGAPSWRAKRIDRTSDKY